MYLKIFVLIFFLSGTVSAETLICDLANESTPDGWPKEQISVVHNLNSIETIEYVAKIPNDDGTFRDKAERIYSRTYSESSNRGGYHVSYCNPDDNEISEATGRLRINSQCVLKNSSDQVFFKFDYLPKNSEGNFSITLLLSDDVIDRAGVFNNCKLNPLVLN